MKNQIVILIVDIKVKKRIYLERSVSLYMVIAYLRKDTKGCLSMKWPR